MIKNIYETTPEIIENIHNGTGIAKVANILTGINTPLEFLHYTTLAPGASIGNHTHGNDNEFYIVLKGVGEMTLDGVPSQVKPGDVIVNQPHGTHGLKNLSTTEEMALLVFEVKI